MPENYLHFSNGTLNIEIKGLDYIGKALMKIADELEKSNKYNGKHFYDNPELIEKEGK